MFQSEELSLKIIREAISGQEESIPINCDWHAIEKEMASQAILPLAYNVMKRGCIPAGDFRRGWIDYILQSIAGWYMMLDVQNELVQILEDSGYKFVIMKGFANAVLYPKPEIRTTGDVDFLVRRDEFDTIYQMLQEKGFHPIGDNDVGKHHLKLRRKGVLFEMHKRPAGTMRNNSMENQNIISYFEKGLEQAHRVELYGYSFPVFEPVRNGLMLLMHTAGHMQEGIGIRHLLDWGLYADRYLSDDFWNDEFQQRAVDVKVEKLAIMLTRICQLELGLCVGRSWCKNININNCYELLDYMVAQGNFGHKAGSEYAGVRFFTESLEPEGFFKRLDRSSCYSLPIVNKYPALRPIGWFYQMGRYIVKGLKWDIISGKLQEDVETGRKRRKLMQDMGIDAWLKSDKR